LTILLFTSICSYSQQEFELKNLNEEIGYNYLSNEIQTKYYFGIEPISESSKEYHFRYQKSGQIIDIFSNDGVDFDGQIINFIQETKIVKTEYGFKNEPTNYIFEKEKISRLNATKVGKYILEEKIYKIPTDSLIKNWSFNFFDCGAINFDYKIKNQILKRTYTCLRGQKDSVQNVIQLKDLKDNIANDLKLKLSFDNFSDSLPKGKSYLIDGWISMYKMTENQLEWREKNKPMRDYLKSIKDTIDNYLELELNRLIPNSSKLNCFDDYRLTFNKNGRLKRMKVDMGFWERMFAKDYQKCRRVLKKAFREFRIDFVDPKYTFYRDLNFGRKEIYIIDPTLY